MACARLLSPHLGDVSGSSWSEVGKQTLQHPSSAIKALGELGEALFPDSPRAGEARPSGWWQGSEPGIGQTRRSLSPRIVCSTSWFGRRTETTAWMNGLCPWGGGHLVPC